MRLDGVCGGKGIRFFPGDWYEGYLDLAPLWRLALRTEDEAVRLKNGFCLQTVKANFGIFGPAGEGWFKFEENRRKEKKIIGRYFKKDWARGEIYRYTQWFQLKKYAGVAFSIVLLKCIFIGQYSFEFKF
jgi:hypothetical protein